MAILKFLGVMLLVVGAFVFGVNVGYHAERTASEQARVEAAPNERCQQLAALIPPITAEIDRLLAVPDSGIDRLELNLRRTSIRTEMREAGCR